MRVITRDPRGKLSADSQYPYKDKHIQRVTNQSLPGYESLSEGRWKNMDPYKEKNIRSGWKRTRNQRVPSCLSIANQETGRRIRIQSEEGWRLKANQKSGDRILIQSDRHSEGKRQNTHPIKGLLTLLSGERGGTRFQSEDPAGSQ